MANPYATVADLGAYLGSEPPADSQRLLARAQDLLDAELVSSLFAVDANGNPTDSAVITGFGKAVCAQVEYWLANKDELELLGDWTSFSIEGISVTRSAGGGAKMTRLCPRAVDILSGIITAAQGVGWTFSNPVWPGKPQA